MLYKVFLFVVVVLAIIGIGIYLHSSSKDTSNNKNVLAKESYWFVLHRASNIEKMYFGIPGASESSKLLKTFKVKAGIPGERPTPLPSLVGRDYWKIIKKESSKDNLETAPYFLTLDIPAPSEYPYGPVPYEECGGAQCDWILPGFFGLHGVNGDPSRLTNENPGSSGCIRHTDEDITYLYEALDPENEEIRYYIEDN